MDLSKDAVKQEGDQESNRWYLAYGSNLSSKVFQGRRGIRPLTQHVVRAPNLEVVFDLRGIPYWEPAFANVRQLTPSPNVNDLEPPTKSSNEAPSTECPRELVGVVYLLTPEDYRKVIATEGGGASYQETIVECFRIPLDSPEAVDFPESNIDASLQSSNSENDLRIMAYTLLAPDEIRSLTALQPSKRYMNIIQAGAREHNLPANYIAYLDGITYYKRDTVLQKIGGSMFLVIWLVPVFMMLVLNYVFADKKTGRSPDWVLSYQRLVRLAMWINYDHVWKPLFGSGEVTSIASSAAIAVAGGRG